MKTTTAGILPLHVFQHAMSLCHQSKWRVCRSHPCLLHLHYPRVSNTFILSHIIIKRRSYFFFKRVLILLRMLAWVGRQNKLYQHPWCPMGGEKNVLKFELIHSLRRCTTSEVSNSNGKSTSRWVSSDKTPKRSFSNTFTWKEVASWQWPECRCKSRTY